MNTYQSDWIDLGNTLHKKAIKEIFADKDPVPVLAPRELEVLHWTGLGKDHKEIAIILDISENTIRSYTRSARYKLDSSTLSQAVAKAMQLRLISPK